MQIVYFVQRFEEKLQASILKTGIKTLFLSAFRKEEIRFWGLLKMFSIVCKVLLAE